MKQKSIPKNSIPVTKCFFPPINEYQKQVERIWENQWLTNRGSLVIELEEKIKEYLSSTNLFTTTNGTLPLQIALKLLGNKGEMAGAATLCRFATGTSDLPAAVRPSETGW